MRIAKDPPPVTPKRGHNASTADQLLSIRKELHKVKKGKKYCKGCGQYNNIECFECNHVLGMICKRAVNNLTKLAKRQGAEDWLKEQLSSEETMQAIIRAYNDRSGVDELTGKKEKKCWRLLAVQACYVPSGHTMRAGGLL